MQSCLEITGITERNNEIIRNDYTRTNQYSETHSDALSNGDPQGKGSGNGGHGHYLPNRSLPKTMMNYSNLDTHSENIGGSYDIGADGTSYNGRNGGRTFLKTISLYNAENAYNSGNNIIDTTENVNDGQVVIK